MKNILKIMVFCVVCVMFSRCTNKDGVGSYPDNFEALWKIIDTRYCYLDSKNIDWNAIGNQYRNEVAGINNDIDFFDLLASMLDSLKDGHVNLYSNFDVSRNHAWYESEPKNFDKDVISSSYLGRRYKIAGGLQYNWIANHEVGYIYYGSFSSGFSFSNLKAVFDFFADAKGLIIDVRENGGGSLLYSDMLASCFFTEEVTTGYIRHKTGPGHQDFSKPFPLKVDPGLSKLKWHKPVIVITNRYSYSATNDFVCRMQYAPNAVILGGKTGGGGGMPLSSELPNGWSVRFSACPSYDADMNDIEGGIEPDIKVNLLQVDVDQDRCTLIDSAVFILRSRV